jgi:hypothetical protein
MGGHDCRQVEGSHRREDAPGQRSHCTVTCKGNKDEGQGSSSGSQPVEGQGSTGGAAGSKRQGGEGQTS